STNPEKFRASSIRRSQKCAKLETSEWLDEFGRNEGGPPHAQSPAQGLPSIGAGALARSIARSRATGVLRRNGRECRQCLFPRTCSLPQQPQAAACDPSAYRAVPH